MIAFLSYTLLSDVHVGLDMGRLIQQSRQKNKMSQKDLAAVSQTRDILYVL